MNDSIRCETTHLTAFSILLDPRPEDEESTSVSNTIHSHILSVISSVGSTVSIAGLTLTVLTYSIFRQASTHIHPPHPIDLIIHPNLSPFHFRQLRRERSNRILLNLSLSLFFLHLLSLCSGQELWNGFCVLPAALLHYFLLTSLSWMLLDAIFMYRILISVFVQPESRFLLRRLIIGWGKWMPTHAAYIT